VVGMLVHALRKPGVLLTKRPDRFVAWRDSRLNLRCESFAILPSILNTVKKSAVTTVTTVTSASLKRA